MCVYLYMYVCMYAYVCLYEHVCKCMLVRDRRHEWIHICRIHANMSPDPAPRSQDIHANMSPDPAPRS